MEKEKDLLQMNIEKISIVKALKGVNLNVGYGEVHALVGENGAGKSTLMKCLIGLYPVSSGDIYFAGKRLFNCTALTLTSL